MREMRIEGKHKQNTIKLPYNWERKRMWKKNHLNY
jgi:hypothetical protein